MGNMIIKQRFQLAVWLAILVIQAGMLLCGTAPTRAAEDIPELPLPAESSADDSEPGPSAHLFLRELNTRQQAWRDSHRSFASLAELFPAVLEQEGVVYNMEANGEWLLQNQLLVFQVLDDYRQDYDVLAWEQDRVWSVNSSGEIGSRTRQEMDGIAQQLLSMVSMAQDGVYDQLHSYLNLAELCRGNLLPADSFRPIYTSLGYQVARPAEGVLLIHRAGKESGAQRNLWYGAVAFGGSCAWLQEAGKRPRVMPYMTAGSDGLERLLSNALQALVAAQTRYRGAYQHYGSLQELSGLYFERLDFSGEFPRSSSGISYSFLLADDKLSYRVVAELSGRRMYTDQNGELTDAGVPADAGELYLPLPGPSADAGFLADEAGADDELVEPAEGLDASLQKARVSLVTTVLNHVHNAEEAHLLRHGSYARLLKLENDGLLKLESSESDGTVSMDGVLLSLELAEDRQSYVLTGSSEDVRRSINEKGSITEPGN